MDDPKRELFTGRAVAVRGNDIDTDRVIPARFLKAITFDGLGAHAFEDDRAALRTAGKLHPLDDARNADATILLVNQNFGCGSSREHAPQAIRRWGRGMTCVVGESFAEIFAGNCLAIGLACPTLAAAAMAELMEAVEADPACELRVDLHALTLTLAGRRFGLGMPEGPRQQLLRGRWDSTYELLEAKDRIAAHARTLPYWNGWR